MLRPALCLFALTFAFALAQVPYNTVSGRTPAISFVGNLADGDQYIIRDGVGDGSHYWAWDQPSNSVQLNLFFAGLPSPHAVYNLTLKDPSNAYNKFVTEIHGGKWRVTIVFRMGQIPITFYRWANGTLAGSNFDYYGNADLPNLPGVYAEQNVASRMFMTDWIKVNGGIVDQTFNFQYNTFQDFMHANGVIYGHVNVTDGDINTMINIYSNPNAVLRGDAPSAISFADLLDDLNNGGAIGILPTYQPIQEPAYLKGRDSIFRGPFAMATTGLAGPFGPRLADTATCAAALAGTPEQQADPYNGDVQLKNWFLSACVLSLPDMAKRSLEPNQQAPWINKGVNGFLRHQLQLE